ncbi:MAG: thiocyanate hydrolase [Candidatus Binataceae bacterium]
MSAKSEVGSGRVGLLEAVRQKDKTWDVLAPRYGVTNPNPPWKTSLLATCDCLAVSGALPTLDRRRAEDELAESVYHDVPAPERQLLALVHVMLSRGLVAESDLASRMRAVRLRLESA